MDLGQMLQIQTKVCSMERAHQPLESCQKTFLLGSLLIGAVSAKFDSTEWTNSEYDVYVPTFHGFPPWVFE